MDKLEYETQFESIVAKIRVARTQFEDAPADSKELILEEITKLQEALLALTRDRNLSVTEPLYKAPLPENEVNRLKTLRSLQVLDTPYETLFDDIVKLAAHICDTPISLISLVDEKRQWFKAVNGISGVTEMHRDVAFCAHTILSDEILEVQDATMDVRFADNPLVLGNPKIKFYAGAPITMPMGENVGSLCVIDRKASYLNDYQKTSLVYLADIIAKTFSIRNSNLSKV